MGINGDQASPGTRTRGAVLGTRCHPWPPQPYLHASPLNLTHPFTQSPAGVLEGEVRRTFGNNPDVSKALRALAEQGELSSHERRAWLVLEHRLRSSLVRTGASVLQSTHWLCLPLSCHVGQAAPMRVCVHSPSLAAFEPAQPLPSPHILPPALPRRQAGAQRRGRARHALCLHRHCQGAGGGGRGAAEAAGRC